MTAHTNPALTLHQRVDKEWVEQVMNQTVLGLYPHPDPFYAYHAHGVESVWYFAGEGVTVWCGGDGRSPVEPTVPGD